MFGPFLWIAASKDEQNDATDQVDDCGDDEHDSPLSLSSLFVEKSKVVVVNHTCLTNSVQLAELTSLVMIPTKYGATIPEIEGKGLNIVNCDSFLVKWGP